MILSKIVLTTVGYLKIEVEGFWVQRFINLCICNGCDLDSIKRISNTQILCNINKDDFLKICKISKRTKCKIKIKKKCGIPFMLYKYRKRNNYFMFLIIFFIICFITTRFIWNIDIIGNDKISQKEVLDILEKNNIRIGCLKNDIKSDETINDIRLTENGIAWIGLKVKGTNLIVEIVESVPKPEIIDENKITSIISNKRGIISKINVQSGTARVCVGDNVDEGTLLVEGVMEGKYTEKRYVNSRADIYAIVIYSKTKTSTLNVVQKSFTGNEYNQYKININNFKINLNKGVSNFKNYDTIETNKKIRLFSDYYLPIGFEKVLYKEVKKENKKFTVEEITKDIKTKLEQEILADLNENKSFIESTSEIDVKGEVVTVKVNCKIEEKIGVIQDLVF